MTPLHGRPKSLEEIRLRRKHKELVRLTAERVNLEQVFVALMSEIREFELEYEEILGARIRAQQDLEWQLQGLAGGQFNTFESAAERGKPFVSREQHTTTLLDDEKSVTGCPVVISLKALYREVAKAFHPDLALHDEERRHRQELMAIANQAYQSGNSQLLAELLQERKRRPADSPIFESGMELMLIDRRIMAVRQDIRCCISKISDLKQTDIYRFKLRVDNALTEGIDLLSEMAARVDMDIERARRQLAPLLGAIQGLPAQRSPKYGKRTIIFPSDVNCGMLYVRNAASVDFRDWRRIGAACGVRDLAGDFSVRLDVKGGGTSDHLFHEHLRPHDLQSLVLYNANDSILARLPNLTGLQELYLSDTQVSDHSLAMLKPLQSLRRVSLFRTTVGDEGLLILSQISGLKWLTCSGTRITEEGLNRFRGIMPGCRVVSFAWRDLRQKL